MLYELLVRTVQGSILVLVLYALSVSPLIDLEEFFAFTDDIFVPRVGARRNDLINDLERSVEAIGKW